MRSIITSSSFVKQTRDEFKNIKINLKRKGYPNLETLAFVRTYYNMSSSVYLKEIPYNAFFLNVPDGHLTKNPIPSIFAHLLSVDFPSSKLLDSNLLFKADSEMPAKSTLQFDKRVSNPITFSFTGSTTDLAHLKELISNRPVIILEDWSSTGESAINFGKTLSSIGIVPTNIACLITTKKYMATSTELNNLINLIHKHTLTCKEKLKPLVFGCFHDYLGNKITRFSLDFLRSKNKTAFISLLTQQLIAYKKIGYTSDERINKNIKKAYYKSL